MLKRLIRDLRGSAALEFALVAPIMVLLYFGMAEVTQALLANRRAGHVASAVGDLVAQKSPHVAADIEDVFNISTSLLRPMPASGLAMRVTSIAIDDKGVATVVWSKNRGEALPPLTTATLGAIKPGLVMPGESQALVRADTTYTYSSTLDILPQDIVFNHTIYLKPRGAAAVQLN